MKPCILILLTFCFNSFSQQKFEAISPNMASQYKYNLERNFFKSKLEFEAYLKKFNSKLAIFKSGLQKQANPKNLESLTLQLSDLEHDFRKMDLYLFLQFATNTTNLKANALEDSIYDAIAALRVKYRLLVKSSSPKTVKEFLAMPSMKPFTYYLNNIVKNGEHELSAAENETLKPFSYLKNNQFYDELVNLTPSDSIFTSTDTLEIFRDMAKWQNHKDPLIRAEGLKKLYKSYNTVATPMAYQYIQLVKGLNAFSKAKKYASLLDENNAKLSLSEKTIETIFKKIEENADLNKKYGDNEYIEELKRYSITEATAILLNSFKLLGPSYFQQADQLFDPKNGRLDIVGGPNRLRMQGVASVYPVGTSTFFANNYEGYYIDLMLLAHEAGHAIQSSLMSVNKISLLNASGPGYFTESFGKFNELLVSHYLFENASNKNEKELYIAKYLERLLGLYHSAEEAAIEYNLVKRILDEKITKPIDLDNTTFETGNKYSDYTKNPDHKGLWMRLETNFKAPLHNINDMLAGLLAIHYFQLFLEDKENFSTKYNNFLKNGYNDTPNNLLKTFMNIDMSQKDFCDNSINFIKKEIEKINKK